MTPHFSLKVVVISFRKNEHLTIILNYNFRIGALILLSNYS